MPKVAPFLCFDSNAEEAVAFYVSVFKGARVGAITRYGDGAPMPRGTAMTIAFEIFGQHFTALNAGPHFKFNDAVSFVVNCDSQEEIDGYWALLTADGGSPVQCGWLRDRFGLSWQIVPAILPELMSNPASCDRVMAALLQMTKLDLAALKAAAEGRSPA